MGLLRNSLLYGLSFAVAAYALVVYATLPLGAAVHPDMLPEFVARPVALYAHAFAASVALLLGPWQFSTRLRLKLPKLHRFIGRAYLGVGVLLGGVSGLYLALGAFGGSVARLGFATLAVAWLATGAAAFVAVRQRRIADHRRWMTRNFALAFAAVTLRLYLPIAAAVGAPYASSYAAIAWLSWVPNLVVAEWLWRRAAAPPGTRGSR